MLKTDRPYNIAPVKQIMGLEVTGNSISGDKFGKSRPIFFNCSTVRFLTTARISVTEDSIHCYVALPRKVQKRITASEAVVGK